MAINFTDFTNARRAQDNFSGVSDLLPNILAGYKAAKAPEEHQTEQAYKRALTIKALADAEHAKAGGTLQGLARDRHDLERLKQMYGEDSEVYKGALRDFQLKEKIQNSLVQQREMNIEYAPWKNLKADDQYTITGQYKALGIDARRGVELWNAGWTPERIQAQRMQQGDGGEGMTTPAEGNMQIPQNTGAVAPGMTPPAAPQRAGNTPNIAPNNQQVLPSTAMTGSNRTDVNNIRGSLAEDAYLSPKVTEAMKHYQGKLFGYSPQLIKDSMSSDPKVEDRVADALAARAVMPEVSGYRSRIAGGSNANEALKEITHVSLNRLNNFDFQVTPRIYEKTQKRIEELIQGMGAARIKGIGADADFSNVIQNTQNSRSGEGGKSGVDVNAVLRAIAEGKK